MWGNARREGFLARLRPPRVMLLAAVGATLALTWGTFDFTEPARHRYILLGILKGCALVGIYAMLLSPGSGKSQLLISRRDEGIFLLFAAWIVLTFMGLARGIVLGNDVGFLLGDMFKFLEGPALFGAAYFTSRSLHDICGWYKSVLLLWLVFAIGEVIFFLQELLQGFRLTSFSVEMSLFIFLFSVAHALGLVPHEPSKYPRALVPLGLAMSTIVLLIGQSRNAVAKAILGAGILLAFGLRYHGLRKRHLWVLALSGVFALVAALTFRASVFAFLARVSEVTFLGVEAQGTRIPETLPLLRLTFADPVTLLAGAGLGSIYTLDSPYGSLEPQHFVHSSVAEVLFRLGVFGALVLVALWFSFLVRSFKHLGADAAYSFPCVVAFLGLVGLITITFNPFVSGIYTLPLFGGMLKGSRQAGTQPIRVSRGLTRRRQRSRMVP